VALKIVTNQATVGHLTSDTFTKQSVHDRKYPEEIHQTAHKNDLFTKT
jgi:hypothetical protein